MIKLNREEVLDLFRVRVLEGLDEAAHVFAPPNPICGGATDDDLPRLFRAIDAQVDALAKRYGVEWLDEEAA